MGQSPPGDSYNMDGVGLPFMQGSAEFGDHFPEPVKWCSKPAKVADPGDLLISVRAPVGATNFADQRIAFGRGLAVVRGRSGASTEFLRLALQRGAADLLARSGGGMFSSITAANLKGFDLVLPPLGEQGRIVDLIGAIDAHITTLRAEAASASSLLRRLMDEVFSPLPKGRRLSDVLSESRAGGTPNRKRADYFGGAIPWLKSGEVNNPGIATTAESLTTLGLANSSAWIAPAGSVVLAMYGQGETRGSVGYMTVPMATNQAVLALVPDESVAVGRFLFHWMKWHQTRLRAASVGAAQPNLSKAVVFREVGYPEIGVAAQQVTADLLDATLNLGLGLKAEAKVLESLRSRLLQGILSRELELSEAYDLLMDASVT